MTEEEQAVEVADGKSTKTKIGIEISDGPKTYRLLLTRPLSKEGFVEEIAVEKIRAIHPLQPGPSGATPKVQTEPKANGRQE